MYDNISFSPLQGLDQSDSPNGLEEEPYMMTNSGGVMNTGEQTPPEPQTEEVLRSLTNALKYVSKSKRPAAPKFSITVFSGNDKEDPVAFVKRFRLLSESQMWDDHESLKYLSVYVTGRAERWLEDLPDADKTSLENVLKLFLEKFKTVFTLSSLERIKMTENESVGDYADRFWTTFSNGDSHDNTFLMDVFISGLTNTLRNMVVCGSPKTAREAEELARKCYLTAYKPSDNISAKPNPTMDALKDIVTKLSEAQIRADDRRSDGRNRFRPSGGQFRNFRRDGRSNDFRGGRNHNRQYDGREREKSNRQGVECFNCRKYGHFARECPDRRERGSLRTLTADSTTTEHGSSQETKPLVQDQQRVSISFITKEKLSVLNLNVNYEGASISALVDTGATASCISGEFARKLPKENKFVTDVPTYLSLATDKSVTTNFKAKFELGLGPDNHSTKMEFLIVQGLSCPIILGNDFLRRYGAIINYDLNSLEISKDAKGDDERELKISKITFESNPATAPVKPKTMSHEEFVDSQLENENVPGELKNDFRRFLFKYATVFCHDPDSLTPADLEPFEIKLKDDSPIQLRAYRASPGVKREIEKHIDNLLRTGVIEPSKSEFAAPIVMAAKKGGALRFCVDYRKLNTKIVMESYPLPLIEDNLSDFEGCLFFTIIDMRSGYHQLPLEKNSRAYTAFICHIGAYQFKTTPFGLKHAPQGFQRRIMNAFGQPLPDFVKIYLDDIVIKSKSAHEHLAHLHFVFEILSNREIQIKPTKCEFFQPSITYLGHVVSRNGIETDPEKVKAIQDFPRPASTKQVRSFVGLATYYRKFIEDFSSIARPLHALTGANVRFVWNDAAETSFVTLKSKLTSAPVLAHPNFSRPFIIHTDASDTAVGATLSQEVDGVEKPISFQGRALTGAETRYSVTEKEFLGIVFALKKFRPYVFGTKFTVVTDHQPIVALIRSPSPSNRVARWVMTLQEFDLSLIYRPGKLNANADALSRREYQSLRTLTTISQNEIAQLQKQDVQLADLIKYIEKETLPEDEKSAKNVVLLSDQFFLSEEGVLFKMGIPRMDKSKLVVPSQLKEEVLIWSHDTSHFGVNKTFDRIRSKYYWPGFYKEIRNWVLSCEGCNRKKNPKKSNFQLMTIPCTEPLSNWAIDVLGPLKRTVRDNRFIVVFTECFTKWPEAVATSHTRAPLIAEIILERIVYRFGAPRQLLSDRGKNFLAKLVAELSKGLRIKRIHTSSYHPSCNGLVERYNGSLARTLSQFTDAFQDNWDLHINSALFAYRVTPHSTTKETPFFLMYGRDPRLPLDVALLPPTELEGDLAEEKEKLITSLRIAQETAKENIQRSQQANEERNTPVDAPFLVGDLVWLHVPDSIKGLSNKLRFRWHGPYRIVEQVSPVNFKLEIEGRRVPVNVHASRIKKYTPRERPDEEVEGEEEFCDVPLDCIPLDSMPHVPDTTVEVEQDDQVYRVEKILKSRKQSGITSYFVKWQGYPLSQATWEPSDNILDPALIVDFERKTAQKKANKKKAKEKKAKEKKTAKKDVRQESLNMIVVKNPDNKSHCSFPVSILMALIFMMLSALGSAARLSPRELGDLYDCTSLQREKVFKINQVAGCGDAVLKRLENRTEIFARIKKYFIKKTPFNIYHCDHYRTTMKCKKEFFGSDSKSVSREEVGVSTTECWKALKDRIAVGLHLSKITSTLYSTHTKDHYYCKWMVTKRLSFDHFSLRIHSAYLEGKNPNIHTSLTHSHCAYDKFWCRPEEKPKSIIVWGNVTHDREAFHRMGRYKAYIIGDYAIIPTLKIGGAIQHEIKGKFYQLDNGLILEKATRNYESNAKSRGGRGSRSADRTHEGLIVTEDGSGKIMCSRAYEPTFTFACPTKILTKIEKEKRETEEFERVAEEYAKKSRADHQSLLEAHLAATVDLTFSHFRAIWHQICRVNKHLKKIKNWAIRNFPSSAQSLMSDSSGLLMTSIGDAVMTYKCKRISEYSVHWDRKLKGKCFQHFPVYLENENKTVFLRVEDRNLLPKSRQINCTKREKHTVVITKNKKVYHIDHRGRIDILRSKLRDRIRFPDMLNPPRGFNTKIVLENPVTMDQPSLLQMMAESEFTLGELVKLHQGATKSGSIIEGIGLGIASVLEAAGDAGDKVISSLGTALKDTFNGAGNGGATLVKAIGDSTSNVIDSTGNAVKNSLTGVSFVFKEIFGGIPGLLIWIVLLPLGGYIVYLKATGQLGQCACAGCGRWEAPTTEPEMEERMPIRSESPVTLEKRMAEPFPTYATMSLPPEEPSIETTIVKGNRDHIKRRRQLDHRRLNRAITYLDAKTLFTEGKN